jgi:hypothetical protein
MRMFVRCFFAKRPSTTGGVGQQLSSNDVCVMFAINLNSRGES